MSFQSNKYKLIKNNTHPVNQFQSNVINKNSYNFNCSKSFYPTNNLNPTLQSTSSFHFSSKTSSNPYQSFNKSINTSTTLSNKSQTNQMPIPKTSTLNVLKQTLESSNKLDQLLQKCRQIDTKRFDSTSNSSSNSSLNSLPCSLSTSPIQTVSTNPNSISSSPVCFNNSSSLKTVNNYKLVKTLTETKSNSVSTATSLPQSTSSIYKLKNKSNLITNNENLNTYSPNKFKLTRPAVEVKKNKLDNRIKNSSVYKLETASSNLSNRHESKQLDINIMLGRNVVNLSKNKFKFLNKSSKPVKFYSKTFQMKSINNYKLVKQVYKTDNRKINLKSIMLQISKRTIKLKRLNTKPFSVSSLSTSVLSSNRFKLENSTTNKFKSNKYKFVNSNIQKSSSLNTANSSVQSINTSCYIASINKLVLASNLINRSKMTINRTIKKSDKNKIQFSSTTKLINTPIRSNSPSHNNNCNLSPNQTKLNNKAEKKYCLFYNRFGRCSRGDKCTYIHDPERIALCPRFLRGTCKVENCPYSHKTREEKMPLCSFFAAGCCNRENCPYSHIYYGKDAEFCVEFAKGFCPLGSKCDKIHINECPDYEKHKKCPRGNKCPLIHRKKKASKVNKENNQKPEIMSNTVSNNDQNQLNNSDNNFGSSFISFKIETSKSEFKSLNGDTSKDNTSELIKDEGSIKIRPSFMAKKETSK